jgi:hypothetical protein
MLDRSATAANAPHRVEMHGRTSPLPPPRPNVGDNGAMNENRTMRWGERLQMEQFQRHRDLFTERRRRAGFCRWMEQRYCPERATRDRPAREPVWLRERN